MLGRRHAREGAQVPAVHGEDEIEIVEVALPDLARTLRAQVVAPALRVVLGAIVRRLADVPVAEAGGLDAQLQACFFRQSSKDRLGRGRATDIAGADE